MPAISGTVGSLPVYANGWVDACMAVVVVGAGVVVVRRMPRIDGSALLACSRR